MVRADFSCNAASVGEARAFVLRQTGLTLDHPVALLVSEISANALIHARTGFTVAIADGNADTLRVEVIDHAPGTPEPKDHGPDAISGRGLHIVDRLAERWGVDQTDDGKAVWFEVMRAPPEVERAPTPGGESGPQRPSPTGAASPTEPAPGTAG